MAVAYRKRTHPDVDRWERYQTTAGSAAGLLMLAVLLGGGFLWANVALPAQHLPWKPLSLARPLGVATPTQLARATTDDAACRAALETGGLKYQVIPDNLDQPRCPIIGGLLVSGGAARLSPAGAVMTCRQTLAYSLWEKQVVQPAAQAAFGAGVASMDQYGTYSCRNRYGDPNAKISEHAFANALDVGGFTLTDGRKVSVLDDWKDPGPKGQFLRAVRDGACRVFKVTLSPDYNTAHANHLHFDMGRYPICH